MSEKEKWIEVFVTYDPIEAEIVKDLLQSGGIEVRDVSLKVSQYPVNIGKMGEVRLYVKEMDVEAAAELIGKGSENGFLA